MGYKSIGIVIGTSRENVRYYCKTHGLDGNADEVKKRFAEHRKNPDVCKPCGLKIDRTKHSGKKLFCSDKCRRMWWKEHPEQSVKNKEAYYNFQCAYCGRFFTAYGNKHRKYCDRNCYILDRFWKEPQNGTGKLENKRGIITVILDNETKIKK